MSFSYNDISDLSAVHSFAIDVGRSCSCPVIFAKQNDRESRYLEATIRSDKRTITIPDTAVPRLRCAKPDGTSILNDGCVHDGKIYVELTAQILAAAGRIKADILICDGDSQLSTSTFTICVEPTPVGEDAITSTDEFTALSKALAAADTISGKEDKTNKVTALSYSATDEHYPSAKAVYDSITAAVINGANIFANPTLSDNAAGWFVISDTPSIAYDSPFSSVVTLTRATDASAIFMGQDIKGLSDGTYCMTLDVKCDGQAYIRPGIVGYNTSANSDGTVLYASNKRVYNTDSTGFNTVTWDDIDLTGLDAYDHVRVMFELTTVGCTYNIRNIICCPADGYTGFSYISDKLNSLDLSVNKISGKSVYINGDSISYGAGYTGGYGALLAAEHGAVVTNKAVSGGTLASGTTTSAGAERHHICESVAESFTGGDYAIISGGFNDYGNNVPLGSMDEGKHYIDTALDTSTLCGALESIFRHIMKTSPTTRIYFLLTHKINRTLKITNSNGDTMGDFTDTIRAVCQRYAVPVIDVWNESGLITYFSEHKTYTSDNDGIHPTEDGYRRFYMPVIEKSLGL